MTQFVLHQQYQNFPLFRIYNHSRTPPQLKINNIKITQPATKQQKQQNQLKTQIHSNQKIKHPRGRANLISRTIQLISNERIPFHTRASHQINLNQVNKKLILTRHNLKSTDFPHRKVTRSKGRNLSSLEDHKINQDFNDSGVKRYENQSIEHFQNAFKPVRIRLNHAQQKKLDTQVLALSFLRYRSSQRTYSRFAQRNIKFVEQRQKRHTFNLMKNRPNTTQMNYEKNPTEVLQPW